MRTIYIDSDNKCHVTNDGTMTIVEINFFDGKCEAFIEGFCCEVRETGTVIYPWKDSEELEEVQRNYEKQLLNDYKEVIQILGVDI